MVQLIQLVNLPLEGVTMESEDRPSIWEAVKYELNQGNKFMITVICVVLFLMTDFGQDWVKDQIRKQFADVADADAVLAISQQQMYEELQAEISKLREQYKKDRLNAPYGVELQGQIGLKYD